MKLRISKTSIRLWNRICKIFSEISTTYGLGRSCYASSTHLPITNYNNTRPLTTTVDCRRLYRRFSMTAVRLRWTNDLPRSRTTGDDRGVYKTRLRFTSIHILNSKTFTTIENVLTACAKTTADLELGRTGMGGSIQWCSYGLDASTPAKQTADEETEESILDQAIVGVTASSWAILVSDGRATGRRCICFQEILSGWTYTDVADEWR